MINLRRYYLTPHRGYQRPQSDSAAYGQTLLRNTNGRPLLRLLRRDARAQRFRLFYWCRRHWQLSHLRQRRSNWKLKSIFIFIMRFYCLVLLYCELWLVVCLKNAERSTTQRRCDTRSYLDYLTAVCLHAAAWTRHFWRKPRNVPTVVNHCGKKTKCLRINTSLQCVSMKTLAAPRRALVVTESCRCSGTTLPDATVWQWLCVR